MSTLFFSVCPTWLNLGVPFIPQLIIETRSLSLSLRQTPGEPQGPVLWPCLRSPPSLPAVAGSPGLIHAGLALGWGLQSPELQRRGDDALALMM